jgi:hypothetical protein
MNEDSQIVTNVVGGENSEEIHFDSEIAENSLKKHFLDYDYDNPPLSSEINDRKVLVNSNAAHVKSSISNNTIDNNGSNATMMNNETKKKISSIERPSTSSSLKITTIEQKLKSPKSNNNVESILSMLGLPNFSKSPKIVKCVLHCDFLVAFHS